ncbi:ParB N-terminal domain-containing protein [Streptomyces sp. SID1046]|uniref:ParB/RepB/Spo0J family partition protein n=1 Tax=Streptomyces sp. SID1046 TaxID=2690249 RepID=UPI0013712ED7|nr:ParB/RepB/Spo0J family partition protein [Streptomyces sp. SID1046]MYV77774.1 ParB N-terminal domain-containing protein [Streptomyces sp. SID1046]
MTYLGKMPTGMLGDDKIRAREYRKWEHARRQFASGKDRSRVDELKASISRHGLREPIILGISDRYPDDVYIGDGHHRAVALMELRIPQFAFHWYWIKSFGVRMECAPFPYATLGL